MWMTHAGGCREDERRKRVHTHAYMHNPTGDVTAKKKRHSSTRLVLNSRTWSKACRKGAARLATNA